MNMFSKRSWGFTMVEIMVVVSIISVISTIAGSITSSSRDKAKATKVIAQKEDVKNELELYAVEHGGYPNPDPKQLYCVGSTECVLQDHKVENKLEELGDYTLEPIGLIGEDGLLTQGIIYLPCGDPDQDYCTDWEDVNLIYPDTDGDHDEQPGDECERADEEGEEVDLSCLGIDIDDYPCVDDSCDDEDEDENEENDSDDDGWIDLIDNCPNVPNPDQADYDGDNLGDACDDIVGDDDADDDGVFDSEDNCPNTYNPEQGDLNGNGMGNACDEYYDGWRP